MPDSDCAAWFQRVFGAALPLTIDAPLWLTPDQTHWTTTRCAALAPGALITPTFPDDPAEYTVIGHWGHGMTSQAFYFVRREPRHRCFLRLAYGGAFGDPADQAAEIVATLREYASLRRVLLAVCEDSEIEYSLGTGRARLATAEGAVDIDLYQAASSGVGAPAPKASQFMRYVGDRGDLVGSAADAPPSS
jgi:hypothetical protein